MVFDHDGGPGAPGGAAGAATRPVPRLVEGISVVAATVVIALVASGVLIGFTTRGQAPQEVSLTTVSMTQDVLKRGRWRRR